ncbi:hypothetical protein [Variovorax sp. tm]|uniref:hypothetical protein n=1 Tax=Variovorax atrisoli TaxID=3394203 RepID=UPI003A807A3D
MLIALLVLVVLNLLLTIVVFCCQRALWARLPAPVSVENKVTVEEMATAEEWVKQQQELRKHPLTLTPEELSQVASYRVKYGEATQGKTDLEVLALFRLNLA